MSIPFLLDENPTVLPVGSAGEQSGGARARVPVVEARTVVPSTLLRISRTQLWRLMHAERDIANVIVAACIWRRIGLLKAGSGVILGRPTPSETQHQAT